MWVQPFYAPIQHIFMKTESRKRVIVIGGGLSGLSAARQLLTTNPEIDVTVLEALDRVGGRTNTVNINGFLFDQGAEYIGSSQKYSLDLAKQSGNELVDVFCKGTKVINMQNKSFRYESGYPGNLSLLGMMEMKFVVWKINRMANKVPTLNPKDCEMGYQWDATSAQAWLDHNVRNKNVKAILQLTFKATLGNELTEISFLYLLWWVHQNKSFQNIVDTQDGLQQKATKLGTQHMSKYLADLIRSKKGSIQLNVFVRKIEQRQNVCRITDSNNKVYECDYLIMACPPSQANKVDFFPLLSYDRKLLCERGLMGSYTKVFLLYKRAYWREKGLSGQILSDCLDSPLMWAADDTKYNENGQVQPALLVFVGGFILRVWKQRSDFEQTLARKLAKIVDEPEMMEPIKVHWKCWEDVASIGGGPTSVFGPGVLSQVEDLRRPEGVIHWAGTELATVSTGYMDGAIESGIRAAKEVETRLKGIIEKPLTSQIPKDKGFWYTKYARTARKWIEWL